MNTPLTAPALHDLLETDRAARVLDVRSAAEFEHGHIHGAYNVPLHLLDEHASEMRSALGHPVVLVCQSGQRARRAEEVLRAAGLVAVRVLDGGMNAWVRAGLPVRQLKARLSLERQVRLLAGSLAAAGAAAALLVHPWWALLPLAIGSGLAFAGATDKCGMAMVLARLPYNRGSQSCDVEAMVRRFISHVD
jgi:rhodanese-related sulfurtransferase